MTDPQRQSPYGSVPYGPQDQVDGGASVPSGPGSGAGWQGGGYAAPDAYVDYSGRAMPATPTTATLGWVALAAGLIALVGSVINAVIAVNLLTPAMLDSSAGNAAALMAIALLNGLMVWFLFGLWAIIQGCVALAQKRGAGQGIAAIVLGLIGPWVGIVLTGILVSRAFATS